MSRVFRVALDARRLSGLRRGVGQYVYELARHLPPTASDMDFLLFVDRRLPPDDIPAGCRQVLVGRSFGSPVKRFRHPGARAYSLFWMNVLLPVALRHHRVDLFHGTNYALPLVPCCPEVVTVHDMIYAAVPGSFEAAYERYMHSLVPRVVRQAAHVIAVSRATRDDIVSYLGVSPNHVSTVYHGVGEEFNTALALDYLESVRATLALPGRFVLHVGAVEKRKNLEVLLIACSDMLKSGLLDSVVLAGEDGYKAESVRQKASELGVAEKVRYLGYVDRTLLPGLYSLASVFSLASTYEGFGLPILEAMACGTPVVTSNVSSLPEVAGDAAVLVPPGDASALERAIADLVTDRGLRERKIGLGVARARQFRWSSTAACHADIYRRVLHGDLQ